VRIAVYHIDRTSQPTGTKKEAVLQDALKLAQQPSKGNGNNRLLYVLIVPHGTSAVYARDKVIFPPDLVQRIRNVIIDVKVWELHP
jgi:hypothetical protein